ncbi:MAG: DNA-directed RNA polymerase sigma-70 factor [Isosphaeraceae bacterium]|jgi:RNA polymerase sigma-70 factor (ECF subfamily)|nr:MAG: DNA-directed RNA polymerase sigma-70 factor [Isosphaeraceae bacterium]
MAQQGGAGAGQTDRPWVLAAVDRFERPLIQYAARLLGDPERARDVVQDTFLKLCQQDPASLRDRLAEWLFTVCRNRALDVMRKERRISLLSDEQQNGQVHAGPGPADACELKDAAARALEILDTLPSNQREVIRLKFQHGFSYREISRISGHSVSNVGFLIHVGLKSLRSRLASADQMAAES